MKSFKYIALGMVALVLAACTSRNESKLENLEPWGSDFSTSLSKEYRGYVVDGSKGEWGLMDADQEYFAKKGRYTTQGKVFEPERLEYWNISGDAANELREARTALMMAFAKDARALAPGASASAQANFDCWVEATEEGNSDRMEVCRNGFYTAMPSIQETLQARKAPKEEPPVMAEAAPMAGMRPMAEAQPIVAERAPALASTREVPEYVVYFAFDSASIDSDGLSQLGELLNDARLADLVTIRLIGHADSAGPDDYNVDLSERRATAVQSVLVNNGVSGNKIQVKGMGESELAVQTGDGVPERLNRRVEIFIMTPEPAR